MAGDDKKKGNNPFSKDHWSSDPVAVIMMFVLVAALVNGIMKNLEERFGFNPNAPAASVKQLTTGELSDSTPIGTNVRVSQERVIYKEASSDGDILGTQSVGATGAIVDGPIAEKDGKRWWRVDFDDDPDGWVIDDGLRAVSKMSVLGLETPLGTSVHTIADSELLRDPGGAIRGLAAKGTVGSLVGGPLTFGGERWWQVSFEDGAEGWIREVLLERARTVNLFSFFNSVKFWITTIGIVVSAALVAAIVVLVMRLSRLKRQEMMTIWKALPQEKVPSNERWEHVLELVNADRPSEWRQAIVEADLILEDLITKMGYTGDSLGEKMKQIEKSDFVSIDLAWEAHRVRNKIVHEGADFILTQREAKRVIDLYRTVFEEFYYV